jgi:hypothetical protein
MPPSGCCELGLAQPGAPRKFVEEGLKDLRHGQAPSAARPASTPTPAFGNCSASETSVVLETGRGRRRRRLRVSAETPSMAPLRHGDVARILTQQSGVLGDDRMRAIGADDQPDRNVTDAVLTRRS